MCAFILAIKAGGQDLGTNNNNVGTNQPPVPVVPTNNPAPPPLEPTVIPLLPPAMVNQLSVQNQLTNQFGPVAPPPLIGPATMGAPQPLTPIMGTSVFATPPGGAPAAANGPGIPVWGPIDVHPHLFYTVTYGNGLSAESGLGNEKNLINTVAPGFLLDFGTHWSIDYTPSLSFYSSPEFKNTVDESVTLRGAWSYENWTLSLSQGYIDTTEPLVETGAETEEVGYGTALNASYQMNERTSIDLGLNQNIRLAPGFTDVYTWGTSDWVNYRPNSVIGMGLGATLDYNKVEPGSDMPSEEIQGRIDYRPGPKLTIVASGGVQDMQFTGPSAPPLLTPIFSASLTYQIFQPTLLTLSGSRSANPSFYANQVETSTGLTGDLHQQLTEKLFIDFSGGYATTPYTSIEPETLPAGFEEPAPTTTLAQVRNDTITSFEIKLGYAVTQRLIFTVFYSVSHNASSQASFSYTSDQVGLSMNYTY